jgi:hypothetical protein
VACDAAYEELILARTNSTHLRLTDADLRLAEALRDRLDQPSFASLVRHLLRAKAREIGVTIPDGEPRKVGRPRRTV